ncbi:MRG-binding protein [Capronia epimyces CBS 606.96]|uniref:MRG-binding protein n=1 Tax=Capronia epimyces CBS 606.96 TaxID=1182542 RepID=W9YH85_9EURO|nr:MRG-binding protein [Capronia epimyces CBS 606.96]EXJ89020.1 MRG-binding protein [Capronia epimyces CBS 606.96]
MTSKEATRSDSDTSLWTDDQESALLQAVVRWKPVGMHKHFRMISIRDHLLNQGVVNPEDSHTSIAGIWRKLQSLYDLAKLDEREDSIIDGLEDGAKGHAYWREFELPREDFEELMWQRRLNPDGTSSPDISRRESTVADTDEPRSSPIPGATRGSLRGARGGRRGGRLSRLQNEIETDRSSRRTSKANSVVDEDQAMEDADEEEEDQESGAEDESSDEPEEEDKKASGRRGGRGGRRGRARRARRR